MASSMFLWLGSGRARRRKVGEAGRLLDMSARTGLPVPPGAILLDEFFRFAAAKGLALTRNERVTVSDAELLHNTVLYSVRLPHFRRDVVVSPICPAADPAGAFAAGSVVDFDDARAATSALAQAWSWPCNDTNARRDLILMETVAAEQQGLAVAARDSRQDIAYILSSSPAVSDSVRSTIGLPRLGRWGRPSTDLPLYARRLQQLLRGLRRSIGDNDWLVEWVDDGSICWLTRVRTVTPADQLGDNRRVALAA